MNQQAPTSVPNGLAVDPRGAAEVEALRKRLGITAEDLERKRHVLSNPF